MNYIVTADNRTIGITRLKTTESSLTFTAKMQCIEKGDNIPIYQIWEEMYFSDFDESKHQLKVGNDYYIGMVVAFTDVTNGYIGGIVAYKLIGTTPTSYSARLQEQSQGQYSYSSPIIVKIGYKNYYSGYQTDDYKNFVISGSETWYNCQPFAAVNNNRTTINLLGVVSWEDGVGTLLGGTLCYPVIIDYPENSSYKLLGIGCRVFGDTSLASAKNFDDIIVSEDSEDWLIYASSTFALFATLKTYYETGSTGGIFWQDSFYSGLTPYIPPDYPFEDDYNGGGGGTGEYTDTSDTIPIDGTPTNSAIASGFVNAYLLTQQQTLDFHNYLYSTDFLTNVKKLMNDPIDYILSFMLAPYTPDTSASTTITIGGTNSEVNALRISSGYKTVNCGTIALQEFWGKFYDYNPYTKIQAYLPFIGMRPLDVDDVMSGNVNLTYRIDVLTGACVATISVDNARGERGAVYNFNGNCHAHIPVSGKNYLETVTNVLQAGVGMAGSIASGNALGVASGAINVMRSAKEQLEHAGELTGATGLLANYTPFLMVSRPSQSLAQNYNHYRGFISNVTAQLGTLTGYTEVAELVQTDIHCTLDEFEEINDLLKSGVYL